jgi:hypothetical protein
VYSKVFLLRAFIHLKGWYGSFDGEVSSLESTQPSDALQSKTNPPMLSKAQNLPTNSSETLAPATGSN